MDPNYAHDFLPSRRGRCKRIIGAEHCGLGENAEVHRRAAARTRAGWYRAKAAGEQAAYDGKLPSDNPYNPCGYSELGLRSWWDVGWWDGENVLAVRENRAVRTIDGHLVLVGGNIARQLLFEKTEGGIN